MTGIGQTPDQLLYSRLLAAGTHAGLAMLVVLFALYVFGVIEPQVELQRLPELWRLPAQEFLSQASLAPGWGWTARIFRGDILTLTGIVVLAICSVPCLIAVMPYYWVSRQRWLFAICLVEVAVILLAASGWVGAGH